MELACLELASLVLVVLPPLQAAPAKPHTMEVVRASVFGRMDETLRQVAQVTLDPYTSLVSQEQQ